MLAGAPPCGLDDITYDMVTDSYIDATENPLDEEQDGGAMMAMHPVDAAQAVLRRLRLSHQAKPAIEGMAYHDVEIVGRVLPHFEGEVTASQSFRHGAVF